MLTGQKLLDNVDSTEVPQGGCAFWWLGQMGYIVKTAGIILYFDPYLKPSPRRCVPPLLAPGEITHADWVLCSHNHGDHLDKAAVDGIALASPKARFACSRVASNELLGLNVQDDRVVALDEGTVYEEGKVRIAAIAAAHEFFDHDGKLGYPYLCFIVEVGGVTLFHAGDTLRYDGMVAKLAQWQLDLAFLPINGRDAVRFARGILGNMTYQEAVDLAGDLQPRLTIPGHYGMFEHNSADPKLFTDYMNVKFPNLAYWAGGHGEVAFLYPRGS